MRQEQGLDKLVQQSKGILSVKVLARLLLDDLANCRCIIYGKTVDEQAVLLAELRLIKESLTYEMFDQRIDFVVSGDILNDQYFPLTYQVKGDLYGFYGRCSTIPKVCGVDLYLSKTYTEVAGDKVRQHFSIQVKKIFKNLS